MVRDPEKRRPTLADRFITRRFSDWERVIHPKTIEQLKRSARNAHRFVLTEDATRRIGEIVTTIPELLVREHQFARAPYDLTWIEFPSHILWKMFRERNPDAYEGLGEFGEVETSDHTIGYLIDHERVTIISGGTVAEPDTPPNILPIQYRLHTEWPESDQLEFRRRTDILHKWGVDAFLWGSTWSDLTDATRGDLAARNTVEFLPFNPLHRNWNRFHGDGQWIDAIRGSVGELRNIIAILLVMNRPSLTKYVQTLSNGRGWYKGKIMPYLAHTTVTIDLDARPTLRLIGTPDGDGVTRRRHEVKGHYKHDEIAREYSRIAGCIHHFQPTQRDWTPWPDAPIGTPGEPGVPRNWVCSDCGGKRWWQRDHGRGTAEKGFVVHDGYDVKVRP